MKDKQKQAFDKAVNDTVQVVFEYLRENMKEVDNPEDYLKDEIRLLNLNLDKNLHLINMVRSGVRDFSGFKDSICDEILSTEEPQQWVIMWPEVENGKVKSMKDNLFYNLAIDLKLKERLISLKERIEQDNLSAYGYHQRNAVWVKKHWERERKNQRSDNRTDETIQTLYETEFDGMKISKSQIQRITGRQ